jgi:hypothetical protein
MPVGWRCGSARRRAKLAERYLTILAVGIMLYMAAAKMSPVLPSVASIDLR